MMIRDSKLLIKLHHIHIMQTLEKYARISKYKIINFDDVTNENETWHNLLWLNFPGRPYRIVIIGCSRSGKTNASLNLINNQPDIDKIYLYAKAPFEAKYKYLTNKHEKVSLKMILKLLLNIQMICEMFMNTLKNTIQERNLKY